LLINGGLWMARQKQLTIAQQPDEPGGETLVPMDWYGEHPVLGHDGTVWIGGEIGYSPVNNVQYTLSYHAGLYRMSPRAQARVTVPDRLQRYVMRVYDGLFNRLPDPTGQATWTDALRGGTPRGAVANAITNSTEFRLGLISGAYQHYLGRGPDPAGQQAWLNAMNAGMTIEQLGANFIGSPEYYARAGSTPQGWVTKLYADVLGRTPDPSGLAFWAATLNAGASRAQVSTGFVLSTEYLSGVVDGYYVRLLNRHSDPLGCGTWVSMIQQGARDEQIIAGITGSDEYFSTS